MKLWKKAAGALKDKHSIWAAKFSGHRSIRNPDLETVIIKATSHDENRIDCKNVQRVFQWLRTSPLYLKPLLYALSLRMQKTRSWIVALKGLMLVHGVFCCNLPAVQKMGRLPFDFSNFCDGHVHPGKAWGFNAFVRSYFAYLDQRSAFVCSEVKKNGNVGKKNNNNRKKQIVVAVVDVEEPLTEELDILQKLQTMIDMLLQIKPRNNLNMNHGLILEAMDCVIVEIFDVYSKFCKRIASVLMRIYDAGGKDEAEVALKVLQKAMSQGDELSFFFEFCRDIGVLNASQCPKIERISEEDIQDLERIINGASDAKNKCLELEGDDSNLIGVGNGEKAIVLMTDYSAEAVKLSQQKGLTTVITHQWEVFDDDIFGGDGAKGNHDDIFNIGAAMAIVTTNTNPFEEPYNYNYNYNYNYSYNYNYNYDYDYNNNNYSLVPCHPTTVPSNQVLPDLISF